MKRSGGLVRNTRGMGSATDGFTQWMRAGVDSGVIESNAQVELEYYITAEAEHVVMPCPAHLRARSVFLAACRRRKPGQGEPFDGFEDFCKELARAIVNGRRPTCDPVFERTGPFGPELELLESDLERYRRDAARSARLAAYLETTAKRRDVFEVVWIESPESIQFADHAREDLGNSLDGSGFPIVVVSQALSDGLLRSTVAINLQASFSRKALAACLGCNSDIQAQEDSRQGWVIWTLPDQRRKELKAFLFERLGQTLFDESVRVSWNEDLKLLQCSVRHQLEHDDKFASVPLTLNNHQFAKSAVAVISTTLWSLVRRDGDGRPGLPLGFDTDHLQGDSGLLSVWSRHGIALAYAPHLEGCQERFAGFREILRDVSMLTQSARVTSTAADPLLIERYARLEIELSRPSNRLLRRICQRADFFEIHRTLQDLELSRRILQTNLATKEIQTKTEKIQEKLEYVELLVITFYTFEFVELVARSLVSEHPYTSLIAMGAGVFMFFFARTYLLGDGNVEDRQRVTKFIVVLTLLFLIYFTLKLFLW